MRFAIFFFSALVLSLTGTIYYRRFAIGRGIIATPNFRTLHETIVPRGGGIVFACVFSLMVLFAWLFHSVPTSLSVAFGGGGLAAAGFGFFDDVHDVRPLHKLLVQAALSLVLFAVFFPGVYLPFFQARPPEWMVFLVPLLLFVPIWFINFYNFIDGIDGMAVSGAVLVSGTVLLVLALGDGDINTIFILGLLIAASLGFAYINMPPAKMFMGDAGSIFLGYTLAGLVLHTVFSGELSVWVWGCALGYYLGDTTTTFVCRLFLVKKWYGGHRSHAYQNLARIYKSHARVTYGVALYALVWNLPLAVIAARLPRFGPIAAMLAIVPVILWTLRFGPPLSSE